MDWYAVAILFLVFAVGAQQWLLMRVERKLRTVDSLAVAHHLRLLDVAARVDELVARLEGEAK